VSAQSFELFEHVPVPIYVYEVRPDEFILVSANAAAQALSPGIVKFLGQPMGALYQDQPELDRDARRALAEGVPVTRDIVIRRYQQTEAVTPLQLTWIPLLPNHLAVATKAGSSQQHPGAALAESEARYRGLFQSFPDAVFVQSADGRILDCNDSAAHLLGAQDAVHLTGRPLVFGNLVKVHSESGALMTESDLPGIQAIHHGKPVGPVVFEFTGERGSRWVRIASQPILSSKENVSASVTVLTDITERIVDERAIRSGAARLDLALRAARMGVWEYDLETNSGFWSLNLNTVFGLTHDRPPGLESFGRLLHPDDVSEFLSSVTAFIERNDDSTFEAEFRIVGDDGVARWAWVQGRRVPDPVRFVGTIMDITEQRRLEDELRRAHRLESIGRLAGGIAHDFNNLLAAMLGAVDLLEGDSPPHLRDDLGTIRHAVVRARDLTRQLLAFARKQSIEFQMVNLGALVAKVERLLTRLVGPTVEIVLRIDRSAWVRGDSASLEQVLVNLAVNAKDAMPRGGVLTIQVGVASPEPGVPTRAVIKVQDEGLGMDEETCRQVFDPFFTTKEHGTGLGLASSYGIVRQHGGDILVESEVNRGTTFTVLLPAVEASESRPPAPAQGNADFQGEGCALVVDDEDLVRSTAVRLLKSLGYQVVSARSAAEALELEARFSGVIDILLCDVAMPRRDGPSLAAELLQLRPDLRIIFVSGYTEAAIPKGLERAAFLAKPYTRTELAAKLLEVKNK
jgi:two-component system, cell cycle sensor histidine kinase and response regulator CckA